mgnify:CR=1 FL=1
MPGSRHQQLDMPISDCGYLSVDRHAAVLRPFPVLSSGTADTVIHEVTADFHLIAHVDMEQVSVCTEYLWDSDVRCIRPRQEMPIHGKLIRRY